MAYIFNESGVMVSIPNNSPLPSGARWANADEVTAWEEAERIRTAAGIPAPKTPQQAQLEHEALLENIEKRGGLATPQEVANLNTTGEQMQGAWLSPEQQPASTETRAISLEGKGAKAGDQYVQYEPLPGVVKVVTDEKAAKPIPPGRIETVVSEPAPTQEKATDSREAVAAPDSSKPNSTPAERAKNSPTAKNKEK